MYRNNKHPEDLWSFYLHFTTVSNTLTATQVYMCEPRAAVQFSFTVTQFALICPLENLGKKEAVSLKPRAALSIVHEAIFLKLIVRIYIYY